MAFYQPEAKPLAFDLNRWIDRAPTISYFYESKIDKASLVVKPDVACSFPLVWLLYSFGAGDGELRVNY